MNDQITQDEIDKKLLEGALIGIETLKSRTTSTNDKFAIEAADKLIKAAGVSKEKDGTPNQSPQINFNFLTEGLKTVGKVLGNDERDVTEEEKISVRELAETGQRADDIERDDQGGEES